MPKRSKDSVAPGRFVFKARKNAGSVFSCLPPRMGANRTDAIRNDKQDVPVTFARLQRSVNVIITDSAIVTLAEH